MAQPSILTDESALSTQEGSTPTVHDAHLATSLEAILLTADRPVPAAKLAEALGLTAPAAAAPDVGDAPADKEPAPETKRSRARRRSPATVGDDAGRRIAAAIDQLNGVYAASGRSFRIEAVAGGYRFMTLPQFAPAVASFHRARQSARLSRAAVETLAIIAYKQPITRAHLEAIRGVACGEVLRSLMERRLVTIKGRAEELGRPILYGTTREFLDAFGLSSLKDLPTIADLQPGA